MTHQTTHTETTHTQRVTANSLLTDRVTRQEVPTIEMQTTLAARKLLESIYK
jgi:hypothetical protein